MELINSKQFIDDFKTMQKSNRNKIICNDLVFVKKYNNVQECLNITYLIPNLITIIMLYVNDEINVQYTMKDNLYFSKNISIYFQLNCNMWFTDYNFTFMFFTDKIISIFASNRNKIITCNNNILFENMYDADYKLCNTELCSTINTFAEYYSLPKFKNYNPSCTPAIMHDHKTIKRACGGIIHINDVPIFKNIVLIITIINDIITLLL